MTNDQERDRVTILPPASPINPPAGWEKWPVMEIGPNGVLRRIAPGANAEDIPVKPVGAQDLK